MHRTPARTCRRTRRALLAAAVPAALAATALPAAAEASVLDVDRGSFRQSFEYRGDPGEANNLVVAEAPDGSLVFRDSAPLRIVQTAPGRFVPPEVECRRTSPTSATCHPSLLFFGIETGDGNDELLWKPSIATEIDLGDGNDTLFAGARVNPKAPLQSVFEIRAGAGVDTISYALAAFPVDVSLNGAYDDGGGGDIIPVPDDAEVVVGSRFDDTITGSNLERVERFRGGLGNDRISGLGGPDVFDEDATPNGSDTFNGGGGLDRVDYSRRFNRVDVALDLVRDDGEAGERDFVDPNVNNVIAGSGNDSLTGSAGPNELDGRGGTDSMRGGDGDDRLIGGSGAGDLLLAEGGNDTVDARDGNVDRVRCGTGDNDSLTRDLADFDVAECESQSLVGNVSLKPRTLRAVPGKAAQVKLAWTHPRAWRSLRDITVRLRHEQSTVAELTIKPKRGRIVADEDALADLVRRRATVKTARRTVIASLPLRIDRKLAGTKLEIEVEATDAAGHRQLETAAGSIRVGA
jgi:hypothetical protein